MNSLFSNEIEKMKTYARNFPWENPRAYASYLAQTYFYVRHSCRLLAYAAGHCSFDEEALFARSIKHISEESRHELLAEKDLNRLGFKLVDFPELPMTQALYETQYYKIQKYGAPALLGYIIALESFAIHCVPEFSDVLQKNYEPKTFTFLKLHAEEDPDHVVKAIAQLEALNPEMQKVVETNFFADLSNI